MTDGSSVTALRMPLDDGFIGLHPLAESHREALAAACAEDAAIWPIYSISYDPAHFDASFDALLADPARYAFAIFSNGALVGMSAYLGVDPARAVLEIGNSYIVPALRGTGFNGRLKRLMVGHAVAQGFRRIEFRVDARNGRSMAAVAKIGGVLEGILRQERITWTGHVRDTALFSILADEWHQAEPA
jgi:RimJ/RimL family protein N-acetyltransferase